MITVKRPLRNEVFVRVVKQERALGGIILSDRTAENNSQGVVISTGPLCTSGLKLGDTVLLPEGRKFRLMVGDRQYRIVDEDTILGTIEAEVGEGVT